jgi:polysaccharide export outer membrane protein
MSTLSAVIALIVALCGLRAQEPPEVSVADARTYPLGPGDVVAVEVVGEAAMSGAMRVGVDGALEIPYAGRVVVEGLVLDAAAERIRGRLAEGYLKNPQVVCTITHLASKRLEVNGGVVRPGVYFIDTGRMTVSQLVVRAGGLVDQSASKAEIWRVTDGVRSIVPVDLEKVTKGDEGADLELLPGDHLQVPQPELVTVNGNIEKAGNLVYRDGMTLTQAIAGAGGATTTAKLTAVVLLRGDERSTVNVKKIIAGRAADVVLRPGDSIYVPESVF